MKYEFPYLYLQVRTRQIGMRGGEKPFYRFQPVPRIELWRDVGTKNGNQLAYSTVVQQWRAGYTTQQNVASSGAAQTQGYIVTDKLLTLKEAERQD